MIKIERRGTGDFAPCYDERVRAVPVKQAYDLLIQSEAGFVSVTGTPDEPCKAGT